jgi:hypothetical protein
MGDIPNTPDSPPPQRRTQEYEDPHYHDEDEVANVEDGEPHRKPPPRRKPLPRPRRRYESD